MTGDVIDAQAQIDALKDLPNDGWAYQSIIDLVNDGIIVGYPDGTFKGNRPMTRYEAAVMVERAVQYLTKKLANPQTASDVSQKDIDALRALLDEFRGDIDALNLRVSDIDSASEDGRSETDQPTKRRWRARKIGLVDQIRAGNFNDQVAAYNGDGRALPANVGLRRSADKRASAPAATPAQTAGSPAKTATGYGYQLLRLLLDGNLDKKTSYHIRVENVYNWDASDAFQAGALNGNVDARRRCAQLAELRRRHLPAQHRRALQLRLRAVSRSDSGFLAEAGRINETDGYARPRVGRSVQRRGNRLREGTAQHSRRLLLRFPGGEPIRAVR